MKPFKGDKQLAIWVMIVAAIYLFMDMRLPEIRLSDPLGPKAFPALVGVGLIASAFLLLLERRHKIQAQAQQTRFERRAESPAAPSAVTLPETRTLSNSAADTGAVSASAAAWSASDPAAGAILNSHANALPLAASAPSAVPQAANAKPSHPLLTLAGMVAWTALYDFCFSPVGYLIATFVFLLGLLSYFNRRRYKTNLAVAIGFTLVFDILFSRLLGVPMPAGLLSI